ncbi:hypothetical protein CSC62_07520 [Pseudoxanthomonas jiangsuensis]|uniref:hypothetical protein n=1 Tax=Pseudoxanthomonas jiangsuensis TaxID=619688 RepID=UPI0013913D13|nr:hypothetical protein [Pseudoxanthomonas jiangsuensis]KAF1697986.1 hypothetical protein CSC62_07520 [Pseudoxanthomonas jiangsuensis]
MSLIKRIRTFFYQSQEFTLWLPGLVLLAVIGYVVLGSIVRVGPDALAWLAELPALCAYAAAWLGCGWLIQRLYLRDLTRAEEDTLQSAVLAGDANARWVLVFHRLQLLGALALSLVFFWPAR